MSLGIGSSLCWFTPFENFPAGIGLLGVKGEDIQQGLNLQNGNVLVIGIQNGQPIMNVHLLRSTWPGDDVKIISRENSAYSCTENQKDDIMQEVDTSLDCLARISKGPWGIYHPCS